MIQGSLVVRNGTVMERREELELIASADLDAASAAWLAFATLRKLYASQSAGSSVSKGLFERVAQNLSDEFDTAAAAFRRSDAALRREEWKRAGMPELADPQPLVSAIEKAAELGLEVRLFAEFARQIGGAFNLGLLDKHGLRWLIRFLDGIGYPIGGVGVDAFGRSDVLVSDGQLVVLRAMFVLLEGEDDTADHRLDGFVAGRFNIPDISHLDELSAWKAIVRMRERIAAYRAEAA